MKKVLTRNELKLTGMHAGLRGVISPDLRGSVSHLTGDLSGVTSDLDEAELTDAEREAGVSVNDLVKE